MFVIVFVVVVILVVVVVAVAVAVAVSFVHISAVFLHVAAIAARNTPT